MRTVRTPSPAPDRRPAPIDGCPPLPALLCAAGLVLAGCGDGEFNDPIESGGGAGDAMENAALIAPYAGTWNLTGSWRDGAGDEAYLQIGAPDEDGEAAAQLHDLNEADGCYERPERGTVSVDDFGTGIFMNDLVSLEVATLTLTDGDTTLIIEHTDGDDLNGNGDRDERLTTRATRNDGLADFQPTC